MAIIQDATIPANLLRITSKGGAYVSMQGRGYSFTVTGVTGTIAAALAANSATFAMRLDPSAGTKRAYIERIKIMFTTIVAFTTPVTVNRRLSIYRGAGAATTGGTAITTVGKKWSTSAASECETAQGGDIRIASTGALSTTGVTFEANELNVMPLIHVGNAGHYTESTFEYNNVNASTIILEAGQLIAIRNPVIMDAAGTWQMAVTVDWYEEDSTTL